MLIVIISLILIVTWLALRKKENKSEIDKGNKSLLDKRSDNQKYIQELYERADFNLGHDNYSSALKDYLKVLEYYSRKNDTDECCYLSGCILNCYIGLDMNDEIIEWYTKIIKNEVSMPMSYSLPDIYYSRMLTYINLKKEAEANADCIKVIELLTKDIDSDEKESLVSSYLKYNYLQRYRCYYYLGMRDKALEDIENAIKAFEKQSEGDDSNTQFFFDMILNAQMSLEKLDDALKTCEKLISLDSQDPEYTSIKEEIINKLGNQ